MSLYRMRRRVGFAETVSEDTKRPPEVGLGPVQVSLILPQLAEAVQALGDI